MTLLKIGFLLLSLFSLHSYALTIIDSRYDFQLAQGDSVFGVNMLEHGYNPVTDTINSLDLLLALREVNDDDATENWDDGTTEFVVFYTILFGSRMTVEADVDTGSYTFGRSWASGESTCIFGGYGGEPCEWDPIASGIFGLYVFAATDNLWVTEATWKMDFTRAFVAEPSPATLFVVGVLILGILRRNQLLSI